MYFFGLDGNTIGSQKPTSKRVCMPLNSLVWGFKGLGWLQLCICMCAHVYENVCVCVCEGMYACLHI